MNKEDFLMDKLKSIIFKNNYSIGFSICVAVTLIMFFIDLVGVQQSNFVFSLITILGSVNLALLFLAFVSCLTLSYYDKDKFLFLPLLFWIVILAIFIRTGNISGLKDVTTNSYTLGPDLDPFLYLRNAREIISGNFYQDDNMRNPQVFVKNYALTSLMPWVIVLVWKIINLFGIYSVEYAAIITPVILFVLSALTFFWFVFVATRTFDEDKRKAGVIASIASVLYVSAPAMIHRTTAGIPEIESLGMVWFWLALVLFLISYNSKNLKNKIMCGILAGVSTALMRYSWGGAKYIYMIIVLACLGLFLFQGSNRKTLVTYLSWLIPSLVVEYYRAGSFESLVMSISDTGFAIALLAVMVVDEILKRYTIFKFKKFNVPRNIRSIIVAIIVGLIFLLIVRPSFVLQIIPLVYYGLLYPFGKGRVGLTVAENKAPYLVEAIGTFGYVLWIFLLGVLVLFYESTKHFKPKNKLVLNIAFFFTLAGLTFSRISESSILNGENFISEITYIGGMLIILITLISIFIKAHRRGDHWTVDNFKNIKLEYLIILAMSFWAIVSVRGAIRLFFIIAPLITIPGAIFLVKLYDYAKSKDPAFKAIFYGLFIFALLALIFMAAGYIQNSKYQTLSTVPGAYEQQWQRAMGWVRNNTPGGSIFMHWWDYGYWIQTIGERPTITDGGHAVAYWNHFIGRYVLTTQNPNSALSFIKTQNASYLLIDSTDLGKYAAYSGIGSDEGGQDRLAGIPVMVFDPKQNVETNNGTKRVYVGGMFVDEDISFIRENKSIYLPSQKSYVGGIILNLFQSNGTTNFGQPVGVYFFNQNRYDLPIRYIYIDGRIVDFGYGLEVVLRILPSVGTNNIDPLGSIIYLSPKVSKGLFAQMYLLNNTKDYFPMKLDHVEDDVVVESLKEQINYKDDFVYYNGFRGPIKIWKTNVDKMDNVLSRPEFLLTSGRYGEFDNLTFVK